MVLILDDNSEHVAHVWSKQVFSEKKIGYDDSFDVTKCHQQIKIPDLLHICAYGKEQPSNSKKHVVNQNVHIKSCMKIRHNIMRPIVVW